jgi:putative inorganic carbon (HCO3(-)) transporter
MAGRASSLARPVLLTGAATAAFTLLVYDLYEKQGYTGFILAALAVMAVAVAYLACQVDPAWVFGAAIFAFVFNGNWGYMGLPSRVAPDRFLALVAIYSLLFGPRSHYRPRLRVETIHRLLGLVLVWAAISMIVAGTVFEEEGGYRFLDRLGVLPFLFFLLAPMAFRTARQRAILLGTLVGLGGYLGLTSLFETIGPHALVFPKYILDENVGYQAGHARGPFAEAEANGVALFGCAVACAMAVAIWKRTSYRLLAAGIGALCLIDCLFTLQRAVWIGAAAGTVVALAAFPPLRRFLFPVLAAGAVGVALSLNLIPGLSENVSERTNDKLSVWDRENLISAAERMIETRPLFGFGWGSFTKVAEPYFRQAADTPLTASNTEKGTEILHSVVLSNAVELGVLGCALWLLAVFLAIGGAIVKRGPPELYPWRAGLLAYFVCWAVVLNLTPLPQAFPNLLLWFWAGIVVSWRYWPAIQYTPLPEIRLDGALGGSAPHPGAA